MWNKLSYRSGWTNKIQNSRMGWIHNHLMNGLVLHSILVSRVPTQLVIERSLASLIKLILYCSVISAQALI